MKRLSVMICWSFLVAFSFTAAPGQTVRIDGRAAVAESSRSHYSRYVNWRPADGQAVQLNPPRFSWPMWPQWPGDWRDASHTYTLQISERSDGSKPIVDVRRPFNFYNALPVLRGSEVWYWRVGYDVGTAEEHWSDIKSFTLAADALPWDRTPLAAPPFAEMGHPRILFNTETLAEMRRLAETHDDSRAVLRYMKRRADAVMQESWWKDFPASDRQAEPTTPFYAIAHELALVCFVWKMTDDSKYAGVLPRAVKWASYPAGGRASPEGLGGDGSEDATQGNEFLALLFDWLYQDLTESQRKVMIDSLEWRVQFWMENFAWKKFRLLNEPVVRAKSLSGMISSHQYEGSMDTAVCGLALYEHSEIGRQWYDLMANYLVGVTCGHGYDEAWNEGPGYGTSKSKWLVNASLYFDTTIPQARLGQNPFYDRMAEYFCRVIPVGMDHNAWGNQNNASRGNHLATFRKLAYLTGRGRFLQNWREYGGDVFSEFRPWIEYVLPAFYERPAPAPERDATALFPIDGWAMAATGPPSLRSTFEQGAGMIFQCRPRGGYGHSFNSDASFQLHAYGAMLNHGGGSSANQDAYAYHTMSHNTILVDGLGQAQPDDGQLFPCYGRIVGFDRGEDYVYVAGDATRCYPAKPGDFRRWSLPLDAVYERRALPHLERFVRHLLMVRGRYFVIFDDLACSQPATYTWLYHILPADPLSFDRSRFAVDYRVKDVRVRLQHIAHPTQLKLSDRKGRDGMVNPITGEDYRPWAKGDILCGHNLWISNAPSAREWSYLAVVAPARDGEEFPRIERVDDATVRVGEDTICFDPASRSAEGATILVDPAAFRAR